MDDFQRIDEFSANGVSAEHFDTFGMMPFGVDMPVPSANVVADTQEGNVRYYPATNIGDASRTGDLTSAEVELAEVQRNAEDSEVKHDEVRRFNTLDEAIEFLGFGRFQIKLILLAGLAVAADAAEMLALSVLAPAVACEWGLSSTEQAVLTMCVFGGMLVGSACWGKMSDKFGRRNCIVLFTVCAAYSEVLCAVSPRFQWVVVFNVMVGFSVGGTPQTGTLLSEFLPARWRAMSLIGLQLFWAVGGCLEALLALLVMQPLGWRALVILNSVPLFAFLVASYWLPESVRYLVLSGRVAEAQRTFDRLAKANRKPLVDLMNVDSVQRSAAAGTGLHTGRDAVERGRLRDLIGRTYRRMTINLWLVWFLSAFCYYGIVLLTSTLFQLNDVCHGGTGGPLAPRSVASCRLSCVLLTNADYIRIVLTTIAEFPAILFALFIVDKWGRRNTLCVNYAGFTITLLLLNICMGVQWTTVVLFAARVFVTGAHETLHVYTPESYPTSLRAFGVGSAASLGRVGAMITPLVGQLLAGADQLNVTFALYASAAACAAGASLLLPFETSGRQLTEHVNHVVSLDQQAAAVSDAVQEPPSEDARSKDESYSVTVSNGQDASVVQRRNVPAVSDSAGAEYASSTD